MRIRSMTRTWKVRLMISLCLFSLFILFFYPTHTSQSNEQPSSSIRDIHLFTVEYQTKINHENKEVYRFDPGSLIVHKGETVRLHLHGFHGKEHHFQIPAFQVKGKVKKGETTTVTFTSSKLGTYELICDNHASENSFGPMLTYITVIP